MTTADLVKYIESLTLTHGAKAGKPFKLLAWQRAFVKGAFKRKVSRAALSVPRGPGKTTLLAAVAAAAVDGPLRVPRGEVVVVASSFEQAKILFGDLLAFTGTQGTIDKRVWRKHDTAQRASLEHLPSGCRVKAIASDPRRAHGLRPSLVIADEPAQWPSSTTDAMYAALNTALGKVPGSRFIAIGTRPADKTHWFEKLLKDADYSLCHAAEPEDNPFDEATWTKALPQLKRLPHLFKTFRDEAHAAEKDAALLAQFRALRLNMGTSDVVILYLLSPEQWLAVEGLAEPSGPCLWGIDLGATAAMSAVTAYWPETGRLDSVAAFPSNPPSETRLVQDPAGNAKIAKAGEGNRRRNGRDDPAVASVLAVGLAERLPKRTTELEFDHVPLDAL